MNLNNDVRKIREDLAEQEELIIWEAAKQKAEAVVFVRDVSPQADDGLKVSFGFKYKICDQIIEVRGFAELFDTIEIVQVPAYMHRIADETDGFQMFKEKMLYEHPSEIKGMERDER